MSKENNLKDFLKDLYQGIASKKPDASKNPQDFRSEIESIETGGGSSGDTTINGIVEQYKVNAGATVNAGDFVEFVTKYGSGEFSSGSVSDVSACKLDNSRVLVTYSDGANSNYGTAVVLSISGEITTVGTPIVFNSAKTAFISTVALSDSKVLVTYQDSGNSNYGAAVVLTIDGTTITQGTEIQFSSHTATYISAVALSVSKVLVAYNNNGTSVYGVVLTVSGTQVTKGNATSAAGVNGQYVSTAKLTDSSVLVAFNDNSGKAGKAVVLTVSGTQVTKGTVISFCPSTPTYISAVALSENKVLVAYAANTTNNAIVLTIDGTTITKGEAVSIVGTTTPYNSAVALTDNKVLVTCRDYSNSSYGKAIVLTIDDTTITEGTEKVFDYNTTSYISAVAMNENSVLVAYKNGLGAYSGITIDGTNITADGSTLGTYVQPATSRLHNVGIAKTSGAEGETVEVYCVG